MKLIVYKLNKQFFGRFPNSFGQKIAYKNNCAVVIWLQLQNVWTQNVLQATRIHIFMTILHLHLCAVCNTLAACST